MTQRQQYAVVPDSFFIVSPADTVQFQHPEYGGGVFFTEDALKAAPPPPDQVLNPEVVAKLIADFTPSLNQYGVPWPPFDPEAFARAIERAVLQNLGAKNGE